MRIPHQLASRFVHLCLAINVTILNALGIHCTDKMWESKDTYAALAILILDILYVGCILFSECKVGKIEKKYRKIIHGIGGSLLIISGAIKWKIADDDLIGSCTRSTRIAGSVIAIVDGIYHITPTEYIFDQWL